MVEGTDVSFVKLEITVDEWSMVEASFAFLTRTLTELGPPSLCTSMIVRDSEKSYQYGKLSKERWIIMCHVSCVIDCTRLA